MWYNFSPQSTRRVHELLHECKYVQDMHIAVNVRRFCGSSPRGLKVYLNYVGPPHDGPMPVVPVSERTCILVSMPESPRSSIDRDNEKRGRKQIYPASRLRETGWILAANIEQRLKRAVTLSWTRGLSQEAR